MPGWTLSGTASQCYEAGVDASVHHGGAQSAKLFFKIPYCAGFGLLMQTIRADEYRGKRVRLTGWLKTVDAGRANLVLRADSSTGETYAMDSMIKRATHGTEDWHEQTIVLDVPEKAATIAVGILLGVNGTVWADDLVLDIVDKSVKVTNVMKRPIPPAPDYMKPKLERLPLAPLNLDFEKQ